MRDLIPFLIPAFLAFGAMGFTVLNGRKTNRVKVAQNLFCMSAISLVIRVVIFGVNMPEKWFVRLILCVLAFGLTGWGLVEAIRYAAHTEELPPVKDSAEDAKTVPLEVMAEQALLSFERITVLGVREMSKARTPKSPIYITYRMRNDGKKPAYTRNITFQAKVTQKYCLPMPLAFDNPTPNGEILTIYPNNYLDTFEKFPLNNFSITLEQADALLKNKQFLFVFGFVEYVDVFEQLRRYEFAIQYKFNHYIGKKGYKADLNIPIVIRAEKISCDD